MRGGTAAGVGGTLIRAIPLVTVLVAGAVAAPKAEASRLITWEISSRHVDPQKVLFGRPPPGEPERPNALRVNVLFPDGYDGRRRFPVLYLLHGTGDGFDAWAHPQLGGVRRIARELPAVIVMPEGAVGFYANWWNGGRRGDPAWEHHHLDEVVPLVEERLRIRRGRRWHAIGGNSMGGLGAMFYASQRPGYFGTALSFSGPLSITRPEQTVFMEIEGSPNLYGDPLLQDFYWRGHDPTFLAGNLRSTRLYVAVGDGIGGPGDSPDPLLQEQRFRAQAEDFIEAAQKTGAEVKYVVRPGTHTWAYARRDLTDAIAWGLFRRPRHDGTWSYDTVATSGEAWGVRFAFADPPEDVQRFTLPARRRLLGAGSGSVTLETPDGCRTTADLPFDRILPSDHSAPRSTVHLSRLTHRKLLIRGEASDRGCGQARRVRRVEVAVALRRRGRCRHMDGSGGLGPATRCSRRLFLSARGTSKWRLRGGVRLPGGLYVIHSRAIDEAGNVETRSRPGNQVVMAVGG